MNTNKRHSAEVRERAVRLVLGQQGEYASKGAQTNDSGRKSEQERLKQLERENCELKRANKTLRKAAAFFAQAEFDRKPR